MKKYPLPSLAVLAIALLTANSAVADGLPWPTIDNHHGASTYLARPAQAEPTVAFAGHAKGTRGPTATVQRAYSGPSAAVSRHDVTTPHGTVSYFAPAN